MAVQVEQETAVKRHFVTLEEYDRMIEAGVFDEGARIELIRGEIVDMLPPGPEHENSVARLNFFFAEALDRHALVWPQGNSIGLPESNSRPQPDITILSWRDDFYKAKRPAPEDVLLLVEVAYSSLKFDRGEKLSLYAEAGIPEYWVVNLAQGTVEVYSEPREGKYRSKRVARRGETMSLPGGIEGSIKVEDISG